VKSEFELHCLRIDAIVLFEMNQKLLFGYEDTNMRLVVPHATI